MEILIFLKGGATDYRGRLKWAKSEFDKQPYYLLSGHGPLLVLVLLWIVTNGKVSSPVLYALV